METKLLIQYEKHFAGGRYPRHNHPRKFK